MAKKLFTLVILLLVSIPAFAQSVDTVWVRKYDGPESAYDGARAIALDDSGNVYVTGSSWDHETFMDYVTIKYYPTGDVAWERRYNRFENFMDWAYAMVVDGHGNVYVTGSGGTIKYDAYGNEIWVGSWGGVDIALDSSGNVYVTGRSFGDETGYDWVTIKYNSFGDTVWGRWYDGPGSDSDEANALVADAYGNVYVTGFSFASETHLDFTIIKYNPWGDTIWVRRYNGAGNALDEPRAIAIDAYEHIYVTGRSWGDGTSYDYATVAYDLSGNDLWLQRYNGPRNGADEAYATAVDDSGNVYVTGWSAGSGTEDDWVTIKYYPDGDTAWVRRYNGTADSMDQAWDLEVDDYGNVYVTGRSYGCGTFLDYSTMKYYSNGDPAWLTRYNGSANWHDAGMAIAANDSGYVYVAGRTANDGTGDDFTTIKYVQFLRGDANRDGVVDIEDIVYLIQYLYKNGPSPVPILQVGDVDCDGVVDLGDVLYLINYLYKGGPPPCS